MIKLALIVFAILFQVTMPLSAIETIFKVHGSGLPEYKDLKWKKLCGNFAGCEGASWIEVDGKLKLLFAAHHDLLVFSWSEDEGLNLWRSKSPEATSFRQDAKGHLYVVEQTTRRLAQWNVKGETVKILASHYDGKKLNRPNDARLDKFGRIWFTDPDALFKKRPHETKELPGNYVFVYDPKDDTLKAPLKDLITPNGIAISPDQSFLFVGDSRGKTIYRMKLNQDGTLGKKEVFYKPKRLDGLAFDAKGRLWYASLNAIYALNEKGEPVGHLEVPGVATSLAFHDEGWACVTLRDAAFVTKLK